jgi:hypothetical protein
MKNLIHYSNGIRYPGSICRDRNERRASPRCSPPPAAVFERFKSSPVSPSRFTSTARVGGVFRLWSIRRLEKGRAALYPRPARSPGS